MKTYRVVLNPLSSMDDFPASDTLFGAICWGIRAVHSEEKLCHILDRFDKCDPEFVLSSSFPVLRNNGKKVHFYPVMSMTGPGIGRLKGIAEGCSTTGLAFKCALTRAVENWKRFRSAQFVSHKVAERFLEKGSLIEAFKDYHSGREQVVGEGWSPFRLGGAVKLIPGDLLMSDEEYTEIFAGQKPPGLLATAITQKNRIDRLLNSTGERGELYYSRDIRLRQTPDAPGMMLYFLLKTRNIDLLKPVFRWMEDTGIGGNRSVGRNHFSLSEPEEAEVPDAPGEFFYTLSRYLPGPGESPFMYSLLPRRNRLESSHFRGADIWKKKIIYFREGSCFRYSERKGHYGTVRKVKKVGEHKIRQNGIAFPVFGAAGESHGSED